MSVEKKLNYLEELVRTAYSSIAPTSLEEDIDTMMDRGYRDTMMKTHPKCYINMKNDGSGLPFFPICNRAGMVDHRVVDFSLGLINKMMGSDKWDNDELNMIHKRLDLLKRKFSKTTPRPFHNATLKSNSTKKFKKFNK